MGTRSGSVLLGLGLAACGHISSATTLAPPPAGDPMIAARLAGHGFPAGEYLRWRMTWAGVLVGRLDLATGRPGRIAGHPALVIRAACESDGVVAMVKPIRGELITSLDLERGVPIDQTGSFDQLFTGTVLGRGEAEPLGTAEPWDAGQGDEVVHNAHSALALLRAWRPRPGERGHFFARVKHTVLRFELRAAGPEPITTRFGRRAALRIDGEATPLSGGRSYPMVGWIDQELGRVPLRLDIESGFGGIVSLELDAYTGPADLELVGDPS